MHPEMKGRNMAVVTHAGGPAVMLTDALSNGGMDVPHIEGEKSAGVIDENCLPGRPWVTRSTSWQRVRLNN